MKSINVILTTFAAGVVVGILIAPHKGSETRKMLSKMPEDTLDTLKYRLYQLNDMVTKTKKQIDEVTKGVADKAHALVNGSNSMNE